MRGMFHLLNQRRRWGFWLACVVLIAISAGWLTTPAAPLEGGHNRQVMHVVSLLMNDQHLSKHKLDDEISARAMDSFLQGFDPRKLYFYQSDIDEFMRRSEELDDDVRRGRIQFAHRVYDRFMERVEQRQELVKELVQQDYDFSRDEELVTDAEALNYPKNAAEARERWRKRIKYNLLNYTVDDEVSPEEAREKVQRRYEAIANRWRQTDGDDLLERFLTAVTSSFDPHTSYMSPSSLDNFQILMRLNLEGIGAALKLSDDGYTTITKIIPGGAADKHGKLKPDDRIVSVGQGSDGEMKDVIDMKLNDVVQLIRGRAGSVVRLGVKPAVGGETKIYNITRAKIELEDSAARSKILERPSNPHGNEFKIGVIDLPSFYMDMEAARKNDGDGQYRSTTRDVRRILKDFDKQSVDAVVLDLRRNGGGSLTEAINLTGLFIDHGPVVQVKDPDGEIQSYDDLDRGMAWDGPLVVLTSKFSASASEILAGAIQDYRRGLVIGDESTHGKGTVQSLLQLGSQLFRIPNPPNLGALKITMQQFYRPNGDSTQKRGVVSDIVLPSLTNDIGVGEDELDYAIGFDRIDAARFSSYNLVSGDLLAHLKTRSAARVNESEEFAKERKRIERYKKYKEEKTIPLNKEKYLARREAEKDVEQEQEEQLEEHTSDDEVFADDFYNKEVIAITLDYLEQLDDERVAQVN